MTPAKRSTIAAPRRFVPIAITLLLLSLSAIPVSAATINVDSTCTLEQAINEANGATTGVGSCEAGTDGAGAAGADTIVLSGNITLTAELPDIRSNITINAGNNTITRTGRLFTMWGPALGTTPETYGAISVTINKLKLTNTSTANSAAISMSNNASVVISDSEFKNIASHQVRGTVIVNNYGSGGLTINNSVFEGNTNTDDTSGAAAMWLNGTTTINNSEFKNNSAEYNGGALFVSAGAVVKINDSVFTGNKSTHHAGGAIFSIRDREVSRTPASPQLTISNSLFTDNTAGLQSTGTFLREGGAIQGGANPTNIYGSYFSGNEAGHRGGVIYQTSHQLRLENSTFYNNEAANEGGAFYSEGGTANIRHVTFVDNEAVGSATVAKNGNAVFAETAATLNLYNSIIKTNTSHNGNDCAGLDTNTNNIIEDGTCSTSSDLSVDPLLGSRVTPSNKRAYYPLRAGSPAIDAANAAACLATNPVNNIRVDQLGRSRAIGGACDIGAFEYHPPPSSPPGGAGAETVGGGSGGAAPADAPGTTCVFCNELIASGLRLYARNGFASGVQFRRVEAAAIGDQSLLAGGFMDAVDVYGWAEQGVGVCFPGAGRLLFLDAASSPRAIVPLDGYRQSGMTCAEFARPGTLLLLAGDPPTAQRASSPAPVRGWNLSNCMVTLNYLLNFRQSPGGPRLHYVDPWGNEVAGWLPYGVTLTALERTADWFKVDYHGTQGWISARHVTPHGTCG